MEYVITDFGGVLVRTGSGNIAINGGELPAKLRQAYVENGIPPRAAVLTCEHFNRLHSLAVCAEEWGVPVIASLLVSAMCRELTAGGRRPTTLLPPATVTIGGVRMRFYRLRYDSIDPLYLTIEADGRRLGIVPDGKLDELSVKPLLECDEVLLGNRLDLPPDSPGALARRLRSISNTDAELDELFRGCPGKVVRR